MGSQLMQQREDEYKNATGDSVYFAVGSFGTDNSKGGLCYRITIPDSNRDIIAQAHSNF